MKWGRCDWDNDVDESILPPEFAEAKRLWASGKKRSIAKACKILSPFVECIFLPSNLEGDVSKLFELDDESMDKSIMPTSVTIFDLDYPESKLPWIRFFAEFVIPSNGVLDRKRVSDWENENSWLEWGFCVQWGIPGIEDKVEYPEIGISRETAFVFVRMADEKPS